MPQRETRHDIERALSKQRKKRRFAQDETERKLAMIEQRLARLREKLSPVAFARVREQFERGLHKFRIEARAKRRRPGEGSVPALVEPPRGPKPLAGGAAAPLEFD